MGLVEMVYSSGKKLVVSSFYMPSISQNSRFFVYMFFKCKAAKYNFHSPKTSLKRENILTADLMHFNL